MALFDESGGYDLVESVERVPLDGPVYDLDVEHTHNFVANGIVTHNSIYSFRGANFRNLLSFESDFPDARVVYLEQNYRSTQTILQAARRVISSNTMRKEKELWTENEVGLPIRVFEAYNEEEEASFVANEIERLTHQGLHQPRDFAVMYRTNVQSRALEKVFVRRRIPHKVVGIRFYERREVKDVLAYLKVLHNPDDSQGMSRILNVPPRGIGQKTVAELDRFAHRVGASWHGALKMLRDEAAPSPFNSRTTRLLLEFLELIEGLLEAKERLDVVALIELVLQRSGYADFVRDGTEEGDERWQNVQELGTVALQYADYEPPAGLGAFLEETALVADVDAFDETANAVWLITFHAAKGLEFPVVFMTGMEEGIAPHSRSFDDPDQMEEERRLAYVAITRTRERLYMVYAFRRNLFGGSMTNVPSRFIADVPTDLKRGHDLRAHSGAALERYAVEPAGSPRAPSAFVERERPRALEASFVPGDRVRHAKFGEGIVVSSVVVGGDEEVTVAFPKIGVKKLALSFAPLERL
jgi:DNA helicase-2/ATP-dependent DNA helicase PcrA